MNKVFLRLGCLLVLLVSACAPRMTLTPSAPPSPAPTATTTLTLTPTPTATPTPIPATPEEVIAYEMQGAFAYFWEQANTDPNSPGYGLVRDRYPGSPGIASIAATGFGLTALIVGVEKGYITREEGYARALGTLQTLSRMERVEGFYYHFVNLSDGKRAWQSEVSSIDTTLLMAGVLAVGQYFGGEVQSLAQDLYDAINWPWFLDEKRQMFYMAYRPEEGFGGYWDFYAEQLLLYILAAGSETHPVGPKPYLTFTRHYARYGDGRPFIHSWFGSIFTYQFSHAWIDFRGRLDPKGVDWYQNSVEASLAHYRFAEALDAKYLTLGPDAWGLTACDGPKGYEGRYGAPPSGYDNRAHFIDDTVPPAGAIGSIIFTPEQSLRAMLNYYTLEPLKGPYGFKDAYNLSQNWYATDVIGIDKGITLLMLANYESGLIHRVMMDEPHVRSGLANLGFTGP